ncbi:hypothetical protein MF672_028860 [Actinomadura sp. ATCC 31491]|uniref:DUF1772 domain-containing protein n=1 Tax=Actinomadura luzonensis TaxID=2805427 RepID=A0ABT0FZJ8_9ACTN|nr:hypothetical protein [Actinomadura luzonensis]MCK2217775.1 hypothetical protein [Actinomadura luzonensis]
MTSLLITVFGNVPLHARFREWAAGPVASDHAEVFQRWELFHSLRTLTGLGAFVLVIGAAVLARPVPVRSVAARSVPGRVGGVPSRS